MPFKATQLRHAVHLAKTGNFHKAAEELQISQAGLSRSIQALEAALGVKLFDRLGSGTAPTRFGALLSERGADIVTRIDDLAREIALMRGLDSGHLSVGAGPYPMALSVMPSVARLLSAKPRLRVRAKQHDWVSATEAVTRQELDMAIAEVSYARAFEHLETRLIGQHQLYFFSRPDHPLHSRVDIGFEDVVAYPVLGTPVPERVAGHFERPQRATYRESNRAVMRPSVEVDDLLLALAIIEHSDVLVAAPFSLVSTKLEQGLLRVVPVNTEWLKLAYGVISIRGRSLSPAAAAFIGIVEDMENNIRRAEADLARRWMGDVIAVATGSGATASA